MEWKDYYDDVCRAMMEEQEKAKLQELKDSNKIGPVVLIANPKVKSLISKAIDEGADIVVLWSRYCVEDTIYQVLDPDLREQIIEQCRG